MKSPIDRFILAKLEEKGFLPPAPAAKLTLLRRATFDLTGLPPTLKEIEDFLADNSPDAFAKVVDRLLGSPQYGENWGRHWLDVARYADSTGMDEDHVFPNAWRYRDYVVKAFNDDLPFDRFVIEQIAGDLLPRDKPGAVNQRGIIATGFLALGPQAAGAAGSRAGHLRRRRRADRHDQQSLHGPDGRLRPLPRSQVRSHPDQGLLFAGRHLRQHGDLPEPGLAGLSVVSVRSAARPVRLWTLPGRPLDHVRQTARDGGGAAEDWAREYALLRPKIAEAMVAAWKVERAGAKADDAQAAKWMKWLRAADEKARQGF